MGLEHRKISEEPSKLIPLAPLFLFGLKRCIVKYRLVTAIAALELLEEREDSCCKGSWPVNNADHSINIELNRY